MASVIASKLITLGHEIHIVNLHEGKKPFFHLHHEIRLTTIHDTTDRGIKRLPCTIYKLRNHLKKNKIDVIIDVESMLALYTIPAIIGLKIRHICWEHFNFNIDLGKKTRRLARRLAALFADDIITLTERDRQLWLQKLACKANIITINNPITIPTPIGKNKHKEKLFLAVGRLTYQKGFDMLLNAWAMIPHRPVEWRLRIVGSGEDLDLLNSLRTSLGIIDSTEILPQTKDIHLHYAKAAFFVLSSRFEGFVLTLLEAQAYGLPAISFDCEMGPAEIINPGESGWLCKNGDITELAKNMELAISKYPGKDYIIHSEAAIKIANSFNIDFICEKWQYLLNKSPHHPL